MAMYSQAGSKRQKIKEPIKGIDTNESFSGVNKIEYKGESAPYDDVLCYRYYNANERIHGRTMEEWIKPSVSFTALRYYGIDNNKKSILNHNHNDSPSSTEEHRRLLNFAFEFCSKLGFKYWTATDKDLFPHVDSFDEMNSHYEEFAEAVMELQQKYGLKPLWISPDVLSNTKYTADNAFDVYSAMYAGRQTKKCLELAHKIGSEGFSITAAYEGSKSPVNTDLQKEIKHFARLLKMSADYKERLGYRGQMLLNCARADVGRRNRLPNTYDSMSTLCFLKHYNLERQYKLIVDCVFEYQIAMAYNAVASLEVQKNDVISVKSATLLMKSVLEHQGLQPGGLNFHLYPRSNSADVKDVFMLYIKHVDTLAKGLRIAAKMLMDQSFTKHLQQRYLSFYSGFGLRFSNGETTLEECEEQLRKILLQNAEQYNSFRQEQWECAFENFINTCKFN